jgi:hypothetical protein
MKFSGGRKLQNVQTKRLVDLMLKLELCFEGTCGSSKSGLFIPSTLARINDIVLTPWERRPMGGRLKKPVYFGRRLQCEDEACTFIPPSFFCRLQVCGTYVNLVVGFVLLINFEESFLTKYCLNVP